MSFAAIKSSFSIAIVFLISNYSKAPYNEVILSIAILYLLASK